jgi:hypothetical protein
MYHTHAARRGYGKPPSDAMPHPTGTSWQAPIEPGRLQVWQGSSQAELQQTPREQKPEMHWPALSHVGTSRRPHEPLMQTAGGWQSVSPAQMLRQRLVAGSQVNGAQVSVAQSTQLPAVSQRLSPVTTPPAQVGWPQSVPDGRDQQVPTRPGRLHATQVPSQLVLQQTPCAQWPLAHCSGRVQGPGSPTMQWPFVQVVPVQSASVVQFVRHDAVAGSQR